MWQNLLISLIFLLLIDFLQTLKISANPDLFYEINLILGKHPTRREVCLYFLGIIALTIFLFFSLPEQWMHVGVCVGLGVELWCVINNWGLGIR